MENFHTIVSPLAPLYLPLFFPPSSLAQAPPRTMKCGPSIDTWHGTKYSNLQAADCLEKVKEEGAIRSAEKQCTFADHQIRTIHQEAFYKETSGNWKGSVVP